MKFLFALSCIIFFSVTASAQSELLSGDKCYDSKDYNCALTNYQAGYNKALYTADKKYLVEYRIGFCYYSLKNFAEAKAWYLKSLTTKNDYGYAWWDLAYILYRQAKYDSAITCYRKAHQYLTNKEDKDNMLYWTAWSYRNKFDYANAINEFKKITSRTKSYRLTDNNIADTYLQIPNYDSALVYAKKAQAHIPASDSMYWELQLGFARIYRGKKEYGKAHEALDISSAANPKNPGLVEWERGITYASNNEYPKATEAYTRALPYYSDTVNTRTLLGNIVACHRKTPDPVKLIGAINNYMPYTNDKETYYKEIAIVQFDKLKQPREAMKTADLFTSKLGKELDSNRSGVKTIRVYLNTLQGIISLNAKDSAKAIKYFSDALRYDYSYMTANLRMGDIAWNRQQDDFKKYYTNMYMSTSDTMLNNKEDFARAYARKAHVRYNFYSYKPSDIKYEVDQALKYDSMQKEAIYLWVVVLKDHYSLSTYRDRCISLLDRGIKKYGTDKKYISDLYNAKGVMLDSKKDTAGTRKAFEESVKIYPDNLSVWDNLLKHFTAQNNFITGIQTCDKLIAILKKKNNPKVIATALVYKGDFLWRQDKKEEARKIYAEALVWDADNATAKERAKL